VAARMRNGAGCRSRVSVLPGVRVPLGETVSPAPLALHAGKSVARLIGGYVFADLRKSAICLRSVAIASLKSLRN